MSLIFLVNEGLAYTAHTHTPVVISRHDDTIEKLDFYFGRDLCDVRFGRDAIGIVSVTSFETEYAICVLLSGRACVCVCGVSVVGSFSGRLPRIQCYFWAEVRGAAVTKLFFLPRTKTKIKQRRKRARTGTGTRERETIFGPITFRTFSNFISRSSHHHHHHHHRPRTIFIDSIWTFPNSVIHKRTEDVGPNTASLKQTKNIIKNAKYLAAHCRRPPPPPQTMCTRAVSLCTLLFTRRSTILACLWYSIFLMLHCFLCLLSLPLLLLLLRFS